MHSVNPELNTENDGELYKVLFTGRSPLEWLPLGPGLAPLSRMNPPFAHLKQASATVSVLPTIPRATRLNLSEGELC